MSSARQISDHSLPRDLAERLYATLHLPAVPETLAELFSALSARPWTAEGLISEVPTRHRIRLGPRQAYTYCALDALVLPFLQRMLVELWSESPQSGTVIYVRASPETLEVSHPQAVLSFGLASRGSGPARSVLCPFINLFPSPEEYEAWAATHPEALTIGLSVRDAFDLARGLGWGEKGQRTTPADRGCY